jgi:hypothetical protein
MCLFLMPHNTRTMILQENCPLTKITDVIGYKQRNCQNKIDKTLKNFLSNY